MNCFLRQTVQVYIKEKLRGKWSSQLEVVGVFDTQFLLKKGHPRLLSPRTTSKEKRKKRDDFQWKSQKGISAGFGRVGEVTWTKISFWTFSATDLTFVFYLELASSTRECVSFPSAFVNKSITAALIMDSVARQFIQQLDTNATKDDIFYFKIFIHPPFDSFLCPNQLIILRWLVHFVGTHWVRNK